MKINIRLELDKEKLKRDIMDKFNMSSESELDNCSFNYEDKTKLVIVGIRGDEDNDTFKLKDYIKVLT